MTIHNMNIASRFLMSAFLYPEIIALEVDDGRYIYRELARLSTRMAKIIDSSTSKKYVGVLSSRSINSYAGILSILLSGRCYVPLSPAFPVERIIKVLNTVDCDLIVVDKKYQHIIPAIADSLDRKTTFITLDDIAIDASDNFQILILSEEIIEMTTEFEISKSQVNQATEAYLLFTSGSTGEPKGIPVNHGNLNAYLDNVLPKYIITYEDRVAQCFDLTFDPSFHAMFIAWSNAATLVVVPELHLMTPHKFIRDQQITIWASVPSIVRFLTKIKALNPGVFPNLRYTLFTGEALSFEIFIAWKTAAPNSAIINGYGPTELTMNITDFWIPDGLTIHDCYNGIVPIGKVFPNHASILLQNNSDSTNKGELLVAGPQQVSGYFNDSTKTDESFIVFDDTRYYKTGDIVETGPFGLNYIGRTDNQLQVRGFRVELNEIEHTIKKTGITDVIALGINENNGIAEGIAVFVERQGINECTIKNHCKKSLPQYMVPTLVLFIDNIPLNSNGKTDKNKLKQLLTQNEKQKR